MDLNTNDTDFDDLSLFEVERSVSIPIYSPHMPTQSRKNHFQIDYSTTPFINNIWVSKDCTEIILKTSAVLPVVIFGVFGNVMVIYILWKNVKIRTPTNLLIGHMAVADSLSLLTHPWVTLTYDFFQNYQLGVVGCKGEGAAECSILIASVISMSAITYDRLTAIVLPKETRITKKGAKTIMVVTWIIGLLLSVPIYLNRQYRERQWKDFLEKYCTENVVFLNIYWYVIITVMVYLPLIIQIICYITIFLKLDKYEKIALKKLGQHINYKKKAAIMMFIVTIVFMVCRLPFTAFIIYRHQLIKGKKLGGSMDVTYQVNQVYYVLWFVSKYLIFINSAINPLIYGVTNEQFLRAFKATKVARLICRMNPNRAIPKESKKIKSDTTNRNGIFYIFKKNKRHLQEENTKKTFINTHL
ncbi:unnamed protein product [Phyllotreta striolata]|uniref:G-protein coupled receptors family 1 profile domain-containing protein n=1 Tax=Phyllotreta striolata TaxID=444603 RepID=A0A9N9TVT9_PHYSR|nr:unnamed protein product [Phyllotreta striolata]